jgi:hypothetical protein
MDTLTQALFAAVVAAGAGLAALAAATGIPHLVDRRRGR